MEEKVEEKEISKIDREVTLEEMENVIKSLEAMENILFNDYTRFTESFNNVRRMLELIRLKDRGKLQLEDLYELDIKYGISFGEFVAELNGCILNRANLYDNITIGEFLGGMINKDSLLCMMHELLVIINNIRGYCDRYGDFFSEEKMMLENLLGIKH